MQVRHRSQRRKGGWGRRRGGERHRRGRTCSGTCARSWRPLGTGRPPLARCRLRFGCVCVRVAYDGVRRGAQGDSRQPRTQLWSDGMSAAQARKALFGNSFGSGSSKSNTLGGYTA